MLAYNSSSGFHLCYGCPTVRGINVAAPLGLDVAVGFASAYRIFVEMISKEMLNVLT